MREWNENEPVVDRLYKGGIMITRKTRDQEYAIAGLGTSFDSPNLRPSASPIEVSRLKTAITGLLLVFTGFLLTLVLASFLIHFKVDRLGYDDLPNDNGAGRLLTYHRAMKEVKSVSGVSPVLWAGPSYAQDLGAVYELFYRTSTPSINLAFPGSSFEQTRKILETNAPKESRIIYPITLWEATDGAATEGIRSEAVSTLAREHTLFINWLSYCLSRNTGTKREYQATMPDKILPNLEGDQLENIRIILQDPNASEYRARVFKKQMDHIQNFTTVATPPYEELQNEFRNLWFLYIPIYPLSPTSKDDTLNEAARKINHLEKTFREEIKNKGLHCVFISSLPLEDYEYFDHFKVAGATKCIETLFQEGCLVK